MKENSAIIGRQWPLGPPQPRERTAATHADEASTCQRRNAGTEFRSHAGVHLANVGSIRNRAEKHETRAR